MLTFLDWLFIIALLVLILISIFCRIYTIFDLMKKDDDFKLKDLFKHG